MLNIDGSVISLTRGDSAYITLQINTGKEYAYRLESTDVIQCQVRPGVNTEELLFEGIWGETLELQSDGRSVIWHIKPEDTKNADPNTEYYWDAQLVVGASGDVFTFIPASRFKILDEVTL